MFPGSVESTRLTSCLGGQVGVHLLELDRGRISSELWRGLRLWKISTYSKIALPTSTWVFHLPRSRSSTCILAQNDSTTASSYQSPIDPMEATRPGSRARLVKAQEVN